MVYALASALSLRAKRCMARECYFLPMVICLLVPYTWPLTPLAICWISPPDFRNASICVSIEALVSTAGAGLGLLLDAFTRMTAINLFKN